MRPSSISRCRAAAACSAESFNAFFVLRLTCVSFAKHCMQCLSPPRADPGASRCAELGNCSHLVTKPALWVRGACASDWPLFGPLGQLCAASAAASLLGKTPESRTDSPARRISRAATKGGPHGLQSFVSDRSDRHRGALLRRPDSDRRQRRTAGFRTTSCGVARRPHRPFQRGEDGVRGSRDGGGGRRAGHERRVLRELPSRRGDRGRQRARSRRASAGWGATVCSTPWPYAGGSLIQKQGIGATGTCEYLSEIVPPEATITAERRTTPLFGLGLVDAVPDSTFYAIAYEEKLHPGRNRGARQRRDEDRDRAAGGRQVRLEVPEPEPLSILRRRVHQRDGHHQPRVSRRELPAGRLRPR